MLKMQTSAVGTRLWHYTNDDYFGAWSALRGSAIHDFIADEETICYILPTKILLDLILS